MNVFFIDGSGRDGGYNAKLLSAFESELRTQSIEFSCQFASPTSHPVPNLVPGTDLSAAQAAHCNDLRAMAMAADAFVFASPEYNGGPSGGLKNLIDWMCQPNEEHPKGNPFVMKPTVLLCASPGNLGGIKGLQVLRLILGHLRALVLPEQIAVGQCMTAFDDAGALNPGLAADLLKISAGQLADILNTK